MIHPSNPKCDVCGERHADGDTEECRDGLRDQLLDARDQLIDAHGRVHRLEKQNQRLRGIVDKLPKTADGVPVVPGMRLYRYDGSFVPGDDWFDTTVRAMTHTCATFTSDDEDGEWSFDKWYSTREAAKAKETA